MAAKVTLRRLWQHGPRGVSSVAFGTAAAAAAAALAVDVSLPPRNSEGHRRSLRPVSSHCEATQTHGNDVVLVVGGGVMGGAAAWQLASGGRRVVVLDASYPGSSWGETRISRLAYSDPLYVNLMRRGFQLWDQLAQETGKVLLRRTPCLDVGDKEIPSLRSLAQAYDTLGLPYEELSAEEARARFPQIHLQSTERGVLQQKAGVLLASECIQALGEAATAKGARWVSGAIVTAIDLERRQVTTDDSGTFEYSELVLCGGPWTNHLLRTAGLPLLPLVVTNEQSIYYEACDPATATQYGADAGMPIILQHAPRVPGAKRSGIYAVPNVGGIPGVKLGVHRGGQLLGNDSDFVLRQDSVDALGLLPNPSKVFHTSRSDALDLVPAELCDAFVAKLLPGLSTDGHGHHLRCLYTQTTLPDEDFIVGRWPSHPEVLVACGFGGEGFKFGVSIGELLAELIEGAPPSVAGACERFRVERALPSNKCTSGPR